MLNETANHAREDVAKIWDPKAQALFETTAEALLGLARAFEDFEQKRKKPGRQRNQPMSERKETGKSQANKGIVARTGASRQGARQSRAAI
jgi:hypothetical protein